MEKLSLMERAIIGNNYHKKMLSYRNVQDDGLIEQKRVSEILKQGLEDEENEDAQLDFDDKGNTNSFDFTHRSAQNR
jgi:hypothetical protein